MGEPVFDPALLDSRAAGDLRAMRTRPWSGSGLSISPAARLSSNAGSNTGSPISGVSGWCPNQSSPGRGLRHRSQDGALSSRRTDANGIHASMISPAARLSSNAGSNTGSPISGVSGWFPNCFLLLDSRAAGDIDSPEPDQGLVRIARKLPLHRYSWWDRGFRLVPELLFATMGPSMHEYH
jgi:hypothetical protein